MKQNRLSILSCKNMMTKVMGQIDNSFQKCLYRPQGQMKYNRSCEYEKKLSIICWIYHKEYYFLKKLNNYYLKYRLKLIDYQLMTTPINGKPQSRMSILLEDQYQILQEVGKGSYASVFKARQKFGNCQLRAIKKIIIDPLLDDVGQVQRLKSLRGDHIIEFYGYIIENNEINLIMKLSKGSLRDQIKNKKQFTPEVILNLMVQVTSAMISLTQKNVMHLDLKPENILYQDGDFYKLCDFGCSQLFQTVSKKTFAKKKKDPSSIMFQIQECSFGTAEYISPQIQLGKYKIGKNSCDVWSFGIILYELIYQKHPFKLDFHRRVLNKDFQAFIKKQLVINFPKVDPRYPVQILKLMLRAEPENRISWKRIKQSLIELGKSQLQFMNLQVIVSRQINMSLIFGTVIMFINDNLQINKHQFWINNARDLHQLKELLIYLSQAQIKKLKKMFEYKFQSKISKKRTTNLNFMIESFIEEQKKLTKKNQLYTQNKNMEILQSNLFQILAKLSFMAKKQRKNWVSIDSLYYFIEQARQFNTLFGKGDKFQKTCQIFDINQTG